MNAEDKASLVDLVNRMPDSASLHDFAREIRRLANEREARDQAASTNWIFGDLSRVQFRCVARERAARFVGRFLPLFGRGHR